MGYNHYTLLFPEEEKNELILNVGGGGWFHKPGGI